MRRGAGARGSGRGGALRGQPLANVLVSYLPDPDKKGAGAARAAARTDERGRYRLRGEAGQDGAVVGWYRVTVEDLTVNEAARAPDGTLLRKPPARFAPAFGDPLRTPLRKEVRPGPQTVDLDLTAGP